MTNGVAKALRTSENMPLSNKQPCGLPIGLVVSLGNAELEGVKLEEEQVVGNSFKLTNERCLLTDVPLPAVYSFMFLVRNNRFTHLPLAE